MVERFISRKFVPFEMNSTMISSPCSTAAVAPALKCVVNVTVVVAPVRAGIQNLAVAFCTKRPTVLTPEG